MKEPEKPKKPERKPEICASCGAGNIYPGKVIRTTKDRKCQECGRDLPGPGNVPPEMVEPLTPYGERMENAAGKKMCGTCKWKYGEEWSCQFDPDLPCPAPMMDNSKTGKFVFCRGYEPKPRKPRPTQAKPERVAIPAGIRFIYLGRPRQGERHQGVMTVAYSVAPKSHMVEIGFSFCSPSDAWIKNKGRELAIKRLRKSPITAHYLYEPKRLVVQIAQALMERRFKELSNVVTLDGRAVTPAFFSTAPSWTLALARRLKPRKVSGISRLKFLKVPPDVDLLLGKIVADILNLGGKP